MTGIPSMQAAASAATSGGLLDDGGSQGGGLLSAALWAAGSIGAVTAVMMWMFDLGARNPADVPALVASGEWRRAPENGPGGRAIPGQDRRVYAPIAQGDQAAATAVATAFGSAPTERPDSADLSGVPPLTDIAPDQGETVFSDGFAALARAAGDEPEASERRRILLSDGTEPRLEAALSTFETRPDLPPNIGVGAEPPPENAVGFLPEGSVGDARPAPPGAPAPTAVPAPSHASAAAAGIDAPPEAEAAAIDSPPGFGDAPPAAVDALAPPVTPPGAGGAAAGNGNTQSGGANPGSTSEETAVAALAPSPPSTGTSAPPAPAIYQVQLGALDSVRAVETRWAELQAAEPALLGAYRLDIQPVNVGEARLYRLRVGAFSSRNAAAELCAALRSRGVECFPASG